MKKLTFILSISLTLSAFGQVPNYVPTDGLVGWWPFNGNANDESGNGNNGTVNGATLTTDRNGSINSAYSFPGNSSNFINVTNNFSSFQSGISISVWLLDNNTINDGRVLAIGDTDGSNTGFQIMKNANNGLGIRFRSIQGGLAMTPNILNAFQTDNWIHYIVSFNFIDLTFEIYLNGQLELEGSLQSPSNNWSPFIVNSQPFNIGRKTISNFDPWNGKIDDIGIWNRALTPQEVASLYNGCQQTITVQPQSQTVNFSDNVQFTASSSDANATYQWQTNLGLGFQNLTDAGQYSGSATNTLSISNVTLSNNNQQFRCIINSGSCSDTSSVAILTVVDNVGIEEQNQLQLLVYPNPTSSTLTIENPQGLISNFVVVDATGREVLSGKLEGETILNLSSFSPGGYTILFEKKALQELRVIKE